MLRHQERVLPLCGRQLVFRHHGPAVFFVDKHFPRAHVYHRLDGKHHARHEKHTLAVRVVVVHFGFFVKFQPNAVSAECAYHAEAVFMGVARYGLADVAHEAPGLCGFRADFETFLCHAHEFLLFRRRLPYDKHARGVAIIAVEYGGNVYVDDVALFEDIVFRGNAVAHHFVDARADALGEAFVVERRGNGSVRRGVVVDEAVDFCGRHACVYFLFYQVEHACVHHAGAANAFYLLGRFDEFPFRHEFSSVLETEYALIEIRGCRAGSNVPVSYDFVSHDS